MPVPSSVNPGANYNQKPTYHRFTVDYAIKKTVQLYTGQLVMLTPSFTATNGYVPIQTTMASNAAYTATYKNIPPSQAQDGTFIPLPVTLATTTSFTGVGVVIGGTKNQYFTKTSTVTVVVAPTTSKLAKPTTNVTGYLATICVSGLVTIRIKGSVTQGKLIVAKGTGATAGYATKATSATAGKTYGVWLQKKTYSSGNTTLAFGLVKLV
jgi:hypothetical protein